jgi:hypothetical protein
MMKLKKYIYGVALGTLSLTLASCYNADKEFPDFQDGTTAYFAYQFPVRTIILGNDIYDNSLDNAHKCQIWSTMGGAYGGRNAVVDFIVDESLCENLYFENAGGGPGEKVYAMPTTHYELLGNTIPYNGDTRGYVEVQLKQAFFDDPKSIENTYVIPLRMISVTGIDHILTGTPREGLDPVRTDLESWETPAKDYVLYCVRYRNAWHANYIRRGVDEITQNGTTSKVVRKDFSLVNTDLEHYTENPVNANDEIATITTVGEKVARFTPSFKTSGASLPCNLLLTFNGDKCTISTDDANVDVTGEGEYITQGTTLPEYKDYIWGHNNGEQVHRDILRLKYTIDFKDKNIQVSTCDTMVVRDRDSNKKVFFNTKYVKQ